MALQIWAVKRSGLQSKMITPLGWSGLKVSAWLVVALRGAWPAQPARRRGRAQTLPELGFRAQ